MEAKIASCNYTKYIKRGPNRWQHCPVVRGKTGRVKQDLVLVNGRIEHHPEGYYSLDWREGGRRHRRALGKDASAAQLALERHVATQRARAIGIAVSEDGCAVSPGVEDACAEFLDETRLQRSPKTFKQYRTALAYFQDGCGADAQNPWPQQALATRGLAALRGTHSPGLQPRTAEAVFRSLPAA